MKRIPDNLSDLLIARKPLDIELEDGVKVNYPKFEKDLLPIPGLEAKKD